MTLQQSLFNDLQDLPSTSFVNNMKLPVHRWFRYSAGFSAQWVESLLLNSENERVLDPFAGSGTALLAAQAQGHQSIGIDPHPFVSRVAQAKLAWTAEVDSFVRNVQSVVKAWEPLRVPSDLPRLLDRCYPSDTLSDLLGLRKAVETVMKTVDEAQAALLWLAFVATIRPVSPVGTAQWQYVLPSKSKAKSVSALDGWTIQVSMMAEDMSRLQAVLQVPSEAQLIAGDARDLEHHVPEGWATRVITSPPYANNYDYADATRLEQTVLGEVDGWGDLQGVRKDLIRACTQHMTGYEAEDVLDDPILRPIGDDIRATYEKLAEIRLSRGGRKAYHSMIVAYFHDMAQVWRGLRTVSADGSSVCFVIGDSAPYGVHIPVEGWLGALAEDAGFTVLRFEKVRDRNTRWKNRKHRVPLHEGNLWLKG